MVKTCAPESFGIVAILSVGSVCALRLPTGDAQSTKHATTNKRSLVFTEKPLVGEPGKRTAYPAYTYN